jgi:hypothetical protein
VSFVRKLAPAATVVCGMGLIGVSLSLESAAQAPSLSIAGAWTLNKDLSDSPPTQDRGNGEQGGGRRGGGSGGGYGGGMRGGGRRGGMGGMGGGTGGSETNSQDSQRSREALRDEMTPPEHVTIVQADSMIVITTQDGRTTRLSPDGKKVKDDNTGIERKTKWDSGKLVSEISGLGQGKITETYAVDPETHHLVVTLHTDAVRNRPERTINRIYEPDSR